MKHPQIFRSNCHSFTKHSWQDAQEFGRKERKKSQQAEGFVITSDDICEDVFSTVLQSGGTKNALKISWEINSVISEINFIISHVGFENGKFSTAVCPLFIVVIPLLRDNETMPEKKYH